MIVNISQRLGLIGMGIDDALEAAGSAGNGNGNDESPLHDDDDDRDSDPFGL